MKRVLILTLFAACMARADYNIGVTGNRITVAGDAIQGADTWTPASLSPVAWWTGDNTAADSVSTNNGTWAGTMAYAAGRNGNAFSFNGSSRVVIGNPTVMQTTNAMTMCAWVKAPTFSYARTIFSCGAFSAHPAFCTFQTGTESRMFGRTSSVQYNAAVAHGSNTNWTHIVGVKESGWIRLYTNGVLAASTAFPHDPAPALPWTIGQAPTSSSTWLYGYSGLIDDVFYFDRALSLSEIAQLYEWKQ